MSIGQVRPFAPDQDPSQSVAVTTTSTAVQINRRADVVRIVTDGVIYVRIDNKPGVTATASDLKLTAGTHVLTKGSNEYIALIADTTATAHIATGDGALSSAVQGSGGGGGGGGDASASNQLATQGSVAPGTAAIKSTLGGTVYNNGLQTLTTGQQIAVQCDVNGNAWARIKGTATAGADAVTSPNFAYISGHNQSTGSSSLLPTIGMNYNGSTYDRPRGNTKGTFVIGSPLANTNRSAAVGTTAVTIAAANATRAGFVMQNVGDVGGGDIWYSFVGTAAVGALGSFRLAPGGVLSMMGAGVVDTSAISVIASTGTINVSAMEY